ncbi:hypothetical protein B296_00026795 [Ensete ventricosum]|uniref:Uncharacterized protein n=1 Tax=Ensete ventricosum TaxID=4639 RepID=A0A426ZHI3_ENSVE|nr:hypothetical protein B296_00026795 [Ensete ventricosum]
MAMTATTEARGQCWPLLCWKKSCGGVVGMRSSRLRCLLPRLDGSIDRYSVYHQGGCALVVVRLEGNGWGCDVGDCGQTKGVYRQRAMAMAMVDEKVGNARLSRDDASAMMVEEEDGDIGAL